MRAHFGVVPLDLANTILDTSILWQRPISECAILVTYVYGPDVSPPRSLPFKYHECPSCIGAIRRGIVSSLLHAGALVSDAVN